MTDTLDRLKVAIEVFGAIAEELADADVTRHASAAGDCLALLGADVIARFPLRLYLVVCPCCLAEIPNLNAPLLHTKEDAVTYITRVLAAHSCPVTP